MIISGRRIALEWLIQAELEDDAAWLKDELEMNCKRFAISKAKEKAATALTVTAHNNNRLYRGKSDLDNQIIN